MHCEKSIKIHSHLRFIMSELLCELFSPRNCEKWLHNFSVQAKVD